MLADDSRLLDILDACRTLVQFASSTSYEEFLKDYKTQLAVTKLFEIIGEAANAISPELKDFHDDVAWQKLIGMRHRLVHDYRRIDLQVVWKVVREDVPDLIRRLEPLVPPEE
jgi:uncharacterized protein with HEPN domain